MLSSIPSQTALDSFRDSSSDLLQHEATALVCSHCEQPCAASSAKTHICSECGIPLSHVNLSERDFAAESQSLKSKLKGARGSKALEIKGELAFLTYVEAMSMRHDENRREETQKLFAEVLAHEPDNVEAMIKLSWISLLQQHYEGVIPLLLRGLTLETTRSQRRRMLTNLACCYNYSPNDRNYAKAEKYAREGLLIAETPQLWENVGTALEGLGHDYEADLAFDRVADLREEEEYQTRKKIKKEKKELKKLDKKENVSRDNSRRISGDSKGPKLKTSFGSKLKTLTGSKKGLKQYEEI